MQPLIEVIVSSVDDAVAAERGGAARLEVVRDLDRGGLTPPLALVRDIREAVALPLRVMVRETGSHEVAREADVEALCAAARELAALGVDGLVVGFLRDKAVDLDVTRRVLGAAPGVRATFHRAFEEARDPFEAIGDLRGLPAVDRILTGGGEGPWPGKLERLVAYARHAQPRITILAGGGIDRAALDLIVATREIREVHVGRAARVGGDARGPVSARLVAGLVAKARRTSRRR